MGTITTQTRNDVSIQVNGRLIVVPKSDIQRVIYGNAEAEVRNYEELKRKLLRDEEIRRKEDARLLDETRQSESPGRPGLTLRSAGLGTGGIGTLCPWDWHGNTARGDGRVHLAAAKQGPACESKL